MSLSGRKPSIEREDRDTERGRRRVTIDQLASISVDGDTISRQLPKSHAYGTVDNWLIAAHRARHNRCPVAERRASAINAHLHHGHKSRLDIHVKRATLSAFTTARSANDVVGDAGLSVEEDARLQTDIVAFAGDQIECPGEPDSPTLPSPRNGRSRADRAMGERAIVSPGCERLVRRHQTLALDERRDRSWTAGGRLLQPGKASVSRRAARVPPGRPEDASRCRRRKRPHPDRCGCCSRLGLGAHEKPWSRCRCRSTVTSGARMARSSLPDTDRGAVGGRESRGSPAHVIAPAP